MNPGMVLMIFNLVAEAIKQEPALAASLRNIFSKQDPGAADWEAERAAIAALPEPTVEG